MGGVARPRLAAAVSNAGALGPSPSTSLTRVKRLNDQAAAILSMATRTAVVNSYGLPPAWFAERVRSQGHRLLVQVGDACD